MSKTIELRKVVTSQLATVTGQTYYMQAPSDAVYPYKTYTLSRVDLNDMTRDDYELTVDLWDKTADTKRLDEMADQIEEVFGGVNLPNDKILPTFFRSNRYPVEDPDKDIQHIQMTFLVESYEAN